jgi:hypothetical protein
MTTLRPEAVERRAASQFRGWLILTPAWEPVGLAMRLLRAPHIGIFRRSS